MKMYSSFLFADVTEVWLRYRQLQKYWLRTQLRRFKTVWTVYHFWQKWGVTQEPPPVCRCGCSVKCIAASFLLPSPECRKLFLHRHSRIQECVAVCEYSSSTSGTKAKERKREQQLVAELTTTDALWVKVELLVVTPHSTICNEPVYGHRTKQTWPIDPSDQLMFPVANTVVSHRVGFVTPAMFVSVHRAVCEQSADPAGAVQAAWGRTARSTEGNARQGPGPGEGDRTDTCVCVCVCVWERERTVLSWSSERRPLWHLKLSVLLHKVLKHNSSASPRWWF